MQITYRGVELELRKLPDGSYEKPNVAQFTTAGRGSTWLDDCRVPTKPRKTGTKAVGDSATGSGASLTGSSLTRQQLYDLEDRGRFPANLLVSDDVLNDGRVQKSGKAIKHRSGGENFGGGTKPLADDMGYGDEGGYSRFFSLDAWAQTLPFLAVPKASKSEKNAGLGHFPDRASEVEHGNIGRAISVEKRREEQDGKNAATMKNHHPTVKPLKLMSYLITLGSRPGDVVLDPFLGSGTTAVAAAQLGRKYVGIEREQEYVEIAEARLTAATPTLV